MTTSVRDNPDASSFEILADDQLAGVAQYELRGELIAFTHTEVDPSYSGRGLARELASYALAEARERGLGVLPFCPYILKVIAGSPEEYLHLVPAMARAHFGLPSAED